MPYLSVLSGPSQAHIAELGQGSVRIGRDPHVEVPLRDSKASRVHADITYKDNQYILRDLKSRNGTLLNGAPVKTTPLKEGDKIQVGDTSFLFSLKEPPAGALPFAGGRGGAAAGLTATLIRSGIIPRGEGESFETLALDAPLAILREVEQPATGATGSDVAASASAKAAEHEKALRSLRALYTIARVAAESNSSDELWKALCGGVASALEADRVTSVFLDGSERWHVPAQPGQQAAATGVKAAFARIPVSRTIVDYALRTRRSVLTAPRGDARFEHAKSVGEQGIISALCVPIIARQELLGLVYADRLAGEHFTRDDQELLTAACAQAAPALLNLRRLEDALAKKERLVRELKSQHRLLGESAKMREVASFIERAAPTESVVLVLGESGTGKELVARAIHYNSRRADAPFIVVNCAALTESLIESELFGHIKGAFTGASADRAGRFEMAHEGTLFLDEIGELSNSCQTKLLRVLEQGEISRVGEGRVRKVDVRVIAATNRELQAEVKAGRFREDLFYRLNVLTVCLPPLRERGDDVKLLLDHYLRLAAARSGRPRLELSSEAQAALLRYSWPGNVRELRNFSERMAVLCPQEVIGLTELPAECRAAAGDSASEPDAAPAEHSTASPTNPGDSTQTPEKLGELEKLHILRMLRACDDNKKLAAEKLGIDRSTLYAKLRGYGII